jgi:Na+/melibiose symporter-like transporter
MSIDKILPVAKRHLLLANTIVWGAPGVKILATGIQSYLAIWPSEHIVWLAIGTVLVLAAFVWMFNRIVKKYSDRIMNFPEPKKSILAFLPVRGWILVIFMMCLGISLKFIPGIPTEFFASFYCGLGPALIAAAAQFLARWLEAR